MELIDNNNVYTIAISVVITVNYCKCILVYSPLNSYLYVHWTLDLYKYYYYIRNSQHVVQIYLSL